MTGQPFGFGFADAEPKGVLGGVNISVAVLIVHGWMYVVYLMSNFRLWSLMRWPFAKIILLALGGVVPFLSFIVEKKFHAEVEAELAANPQAPSATRPRRAGVPPSDVSLRHTGRPSMCGGATAQSRLGR